MCGKCAAKLAPNSLVYIFSMTTCKMRDELVVINFAKERDLSLVLVHLKTASFWLSVAPL
jgi:hypothetical protein